MILIIDDDFLFAETIAQNCRRGLRGGGAGKTATAGAAPASDTKVAPVTQAAPAPEIKIIGDAITAIQWLGATGVVPELIFLDVLLVGPDAFTFLNELRSYSETATVPVALTHDLRFLEKFTAADLADYGVVALLAKNRLRPQTVQKLARRYAGAGVANAESTAATPTTAATTTPTTASTTPAEATP